MGSENVVVVYAIGGRVECRALGMVMVDGRVQLLSCPVYTLFLVLRPMIFHYIPTPAACGGES